MKRKENKNQILCHFPLMSSLERNWNEICLLFSPKQASVQALPAHFHVTPALNVMTIVAVSGSAGIWLQLKITPFLLI